MCCESAESFCLMLSTVDNTSFTTCHHLLGSHILHRCWQVQQTSPHVPLHGAVPTHKLNGMIAEPLAVSSNSLMTRVVTTSSNTAVITNIVANKQTKLSQNNTVQHCSYHWTDVVMLLGSQMWQICSKSLHSSVLTVTQACVNPSRHLQV